MSQQVVLQSLVPKLTSRFSGETRISVEISMGLLGVLLLSLLAQVAIRLPWTPVPVTGQTFGVALTALLWGRTRAFGVVASYLILGFVGLPVMAAGQALTLGATGGYLGGMLLAAFVVGELADRGFTQSWWRAFLAAASGSVIIFTCGLLVLSFYVPYENLFISGLLPFLPGDLFKNLLASFIASRGNRLR